MQATPPSLRTGPFSNRCVNCAGELASPEGKGGKERGRKGERNSKGVKAGVEGKDVKKRGRKETPRRRNE